MNEWEVVGVLVMLTGLIGTFVRAAVGMTRSIQQNTDATERLNGTLEGFRENNEKEHDRFSGKLENHEHRIIVLEQHERGGVE